MSGGVRLFAAGGGLAWRGGGALGGHLGVEGEEGFEAFGIVFEAAAEVDAFEGFVVAVVGGAQVGGHFVVVVEIGDGCGEMRLAGEQDVLRATGQIGFVLLGASGVAFLFWLKGLACSLQIMRFPSNIFEMQSAKKTVLEICAGAGGQALGLEAAGFHAVAAVEIDSAACATLRLNRPFLNVIEGDVRTFDGRPFNGIDLLAGGVPCPPFSIAGKQLGKNDERDLFPEALRLVKEIQPRAVMLENVKGFASEKFKDYRNALFAEFYKLGYLPTFQVLQASDLGVPQLRPRFVLVALREKDFGRFRWDFDKVPARSVGKSLVDLMKANGWGGSAAWAAKADKIAPTLVGGSKKHGGPDLGPTRAKRQWAELGVDGMGIANEAPANDFPIDSMPRLTVRMAARIQGFPDDWTFSGKKTAAYRQVGNAFPPPVASFVASRILDAFRTSQKNVVYSQPEPAQLLLLERRQKKYPSHAAKKRIQTAHP